MGEAARRRAAGELPARAASRAGPPHRVTGRRRPGWVALRISAVLYGVTVLGGMVCQHRYESDTTPEEWEHVGEFMLVLLVGIVATVFLLLGLSRRSTAVACASMALAGLLGAVTMASRDLARWVAAILFALAFGFGGLALARTWPGRPRGTRGRR